MTADRPDPPLPHDGWRRLHPLSPVARVGRLVPALVFLFLVSTVHSKAENSTVETDYLIVITLVSVVYGYIHWMVTRWRFEGDTLRIETGLIRKDSRRLPLARDAGRRHRPPPAGPHARRVRAAHPPGRVGLDRRQAGLPRPRRRRPNSGSSSWPGTTTPRRAASSNTGLPMASVTHGRLLGSVLLSLISIVLVGTVAALAVLDQFEPRTAAGGGRLPGRVPPQLRRRGVAPALGPVRLHRGRGTGGGAHPARAPADDLRDGPLRRIQAVRQVEPLLWRPFGWCRLEVDVAGATARNQRGEGTSVVRKALLPGGLAAGLLAPPGPPAGRTRPGADAATVAGPLQGAVELPLPVGRPRRRPRRLRDGADQPGDDVGPSREVTEHPPGPGPAAAAARAGHRARRRRGEAGPGRVQGPRGGGGGPPGRGADRAQPAARLRHRPAPAASNGHEGVPPSGWYPDPVGRHEQRYWHEGQWTEHVADGGRRSSEAATPTS